MIFILLALANACSKRMLKKKETPARRPELRAKLLGTAANSHAGKKKKKPKKSCSSGPWLGPSNLRNCSGGEWNAPHTRSTAHDFATPFTRCGLQSEVRVSQAQATVAAYDHTTG